MSRERPSGSELGAESTGRCRPVVEYLGSIHITSTGGRSVFHILARPTLSIWSEFGRVGVSSSSNGGSSAGESRNTTISTHRISRITTHNRAGIPSTRSGIPGLTSDSVGDGTTSGIRNTTHSGVFCMKVSTTLVITTRCTRCCIVGGCRISWKPSTSIPCLNIARYGIPITVGNLCCTGVGLGIGGTGCSIPSIVCIACICCIRFSSARCYYSGSTAESLLIGSCSICYSNNTCWTRSSTVIESRY